MKGTESELESQRLAQRGLDALNLFVANIQTGFGPFIAIYLATRHWTQAAIGFALSVGTMTSMVSQIPAGALVDLAPSKSSVGFASLLAFGVSALLLAIAPSPIFVYVAELLHGFSSCTLGPAVAAISLGLAGRSVLGLRLGRNTRFAAMGNAMGAALMGAAGYFVSERSVFFLTASLTVPALVTVLPVLQVERPGAWSRVDPDASARTHANRILAILLDRRFFVFALAIALFTLGDSAMLPLAGTGLAKSSGRDADLLIAAGILLPQAVAAVISPALGRLAESRGRRPVLLLGFGALPLRGILLAFAAHSDWIVAIQALDGLAAACLGTMIPLVTADLAAGSGHYNVSLGVIGLAMGLGATLSTAVAGEVADRLGDPSAFALLAISGLAALILVGAVMPETRPR
ncbi:MAG: MFS transporter [Betaproteobacteria bacterium]|nr:MFS transporter [Betaproteobacteria bacterium]